MKRLLLIFAGLFVYAATSAPQSYEPIKDCKITKSYGMISMTWRLSGNVYLVTDKNESADLYAKVRRKKGEYASLYVKEVERVPCRCGEWRWVKDKKDANFTVKFVDDMFFDFTVKFVGKDELSGSSR
jgi:hypothetical protein